MKLSARTIDLLKNFNLISPIGLIFPEGNVISVEPQPHRTMVAVAEIDETIEDRFAINDVTQLCNCIESFNTPQLVLKGTKLIVSDVTNQSQGLFTLNTANESTIKVPRTIKFPVDDSNIIFQLTADIYSRIMKGIAVVQSPHIAIIGDGTSLSCSGYNKENSGINQFNIPLGDTNKTIKFIIDVNNFNKLYKHYDYLVTLSQKGIAKFAGDRLTYYLAECS